MARSRVSPVAIRRALYADRWVPRYRAALQRELNRQVRQVAAEALTLTPDTDRHVTEWQEKLDRVKKRWVYPIVITGYQLAGKEVMRIEKGGKSGDNVLGKAEAPPPPISMGREEGGQFLLRGDFESVDRWVSTTSVGESQTSAKKLEKIWKDAVASRDPETGAAWTPDQISKQILRRGLVGNRHRADMLARTGAIWSVNEGAQQRYRAAGVKAERWLTTKDDALCDYCQGMNDQVVSIDEPFWSAGSEYGNPAQVGSSLKLPYEVQHPPLHPRCRCSLIPVILPGEITAQRAPEIKLPVRGIARKPKPPTVAPTTVSLSDATKAVSERFNNKVAINLEGAVTSKQRAVLAERASVLDEELGRMQAQFSEFKAWTQEPDMLSNITLSSKTRLTDEFGDVFMGSYSFQERIVQLGRGRSTRTRKLLFGKWTVSRGGFDSISRHEIAHSFFRGKLTPTKRAEWIKFHRSKSSEFWEKSVSKYAAAKNGAGEAFAEGFAAYTHPSYGVTRRLPKEIEQFFDTVLKGA